MNQKHIAVTAILTAIIVFVLSGLFYARTFFGRMIYSSISGSSVSSGYSKFLKIESMLDSRYMGDMDKESMMENAYGAYVASIGDPYTGYLDEKSYAKMKENLSGDYVGIGIEVRATEDKLLVSGVNPGSPAENAGILAGDFIISINSVSYTGAQINEAVDAIKSSPADEPVKIQLERDGAPIDVEVLRSEIEIDYITSKIIEDDIGYIRIKTFGNDILNEFEAALEELTQTGMKSLIIDLRSNPGGMLDQVVEMTDLLVPEGIITTVREKDGSVKEYKSGKDEISVPMCVLIDSGSASASEVMSGALRDYGKATLIGEKTFGKGVVQAIYEFGDDTAMRITVAKYYTPSGECIHGSGIKPDIEIALPEGEYISEFKDDIANDTQLQKAIEVLKK